MKRLIISLIAMVFLSAGFVSAQELNGIGVVGGIGVGNTHSQGWESTAQLTYSGGVACRIELPHSFSIQPEILYHAKSSQLDQRMAGTTLFSVGTTIGYLEIPVQIQWGEDMGGWRPYFFLEPFVGFGLHNSIATGRGIKFNSWDKETANVRRFEYGVALGAGVEIWKIQVSAHYYMNIGSLCKDAGLKNSDNLYAASSAHAYKGHNFQGLELSLGFFF